MRAVVQRVSGATVHVGGREVGRCDEGLLLFVGVHREDTEQSAEKLAEKVSTLRIFADFQGKMNLSILDFPAPHGFDRSVLAISNFTVYGDAARNRRPSFTQSAPYEMGERLFVVFVHALRSRGISVQTGVFGAEMRVALINDGPVTLVLDAS